MRKRVDFLSFDGTKLNGIIEIPEKKKIKGGVLLLHGCPSEKNEDGFHSEEPNKNGRYKKQGGMAEYLSQSGYLSLRFDYREQGENFKTSDMTSLSISGMVSDTESGYFELKNNLPANTPIYVVGTSFAGGIAVKWINSYNRTVNCLFLMAPLLDFAYTIRKTNVTKIDNRGMEILKKEAIFELNKNGFLISGGKKMNKEFINEVMMMNIKEEFQRLNVKSVIFHGTLDTVVPYETSVEFEKLSNGNCELVSIENAVHGFGIEGDLDWEADETLSNHERIYEEMIKRIDNDY